jgi:hypothetical protein
LPFQPTEIIELPNQPNKNVSDNFSNQEMHFQRSQLEKQKKKIRSNHHVVFS